MSIYTYFPNPKDDDYVRFTGVDPNDIPNPSNGWFEAIVYYIGLVLLWIDRIIIGFITIIYYLFLIFYHWFISLHSLFSFFSLERIPRFP